MTKKVTPISGCIISRVDHPVTFGEGVDTCILPPRGRLLMDDVSLYTSNKNYTVVLDETQEGGK